MAIWRLERIAVLAGALVCAPASAADPKIATLDVPGMYCSLCQISVRKALERVPGVVGTKADNNAKRADVTYDPARVTADELASALTKSGFPATVRSP